MSGAAQLNGGVHWALYNACINADLPTIKACIKSGGDPHFTDFFEWTPLHEVSSQGNIEAFFAMLPNITSINQPDKNGKAPRDCARGSMKTLFAIAAEWKVSDVDWDFLALNVDYKNTKSMRKVTVARVAHLAADASAVRFFRAGKTSPFASVDIAKAITITVDNDGDLVFAMPGGKKDSKIMHFCRLEKNHFSKWLPKIAEHWGDKLQGDWDVPVNTPAAEGGVPNDHHQMDHNGVDDKSSQMVRVEDHVAVEEHPAAD